MSERVTLQTARVKPLFSVLSLSPTVLVEQLGLIRMV
jgi:hypothetical protein